MPSQIGSAFPIASPTLQDEADVEQAALWIWTGDGVNVGAESHLTTLANRVTSIEGRLGGAGAIADGSAVFNTSKFSLLKDSSSTIINFTIADGGAVTNTFSFPLTGGPVAEIATTSLPQTLSNKQLASPIINGTATFNDAIQLTNDSSLKRISQSGFNANVAGTFDTISLVSFRAAEYLLLANSASGYQITKLLVIHDGANAYTTEYGTMSTGSLTAVYSGSVSGGNVVLSATLNLAGSISAVRTMLK